MSHQQQQAHFDISSNSTLTTNTIATTTNASVSSSPQLNKAQMAIAEAMALKMHEEEKKKREEKKRKRDNEELLSKQVRTKLENERKKLDDSESINASTNQELYSLFNDLQMISHDHNISFDTPELVVVGMQSDGKSSFIESLLGFQFNIVETNIGTRRPLIIQMINNPSKQQPSCRFKKEDYSNSYGGSSSSTSTTSGNSNHNTDKQQNVSSSQGGGGGSNNLNEDKWEEYETPVNELTEEIIRRTNERTGRAGDRVSSIPIFLRVEFAHCSNLNIYDTPGFRKGGDERLKYEISEMVKKLIEPKNRIIVCLEQSNVEWANTISRPLVKKIDPDFSRTILVNTKFDNRVKELRNRESAHKYLEGEGIIAQKKPFFISLPLKRNLETHRFKDAMKETFLDDYRKLLEIGFDENRFGGQIGIYKVRQYVENLLHEKYQQNLLPSMLQLESICKKTEADIVRVKKELSDNNIVTLKEKVMRFVSNFNGQIERLLEGSVVGDPDEFGQTLLQEKENCSVQPWPGYNFDFDIQNSNYSLYGGAQYERLLNEFEFVIHSKEFPETSINEVASAIGVSKSHNSPIYELAATNIFQTKSKKVLLPLIDIVLQRSSYIMKRLFDISVSILGKDENESSHTVSLYEHFLKELQSQYEKFIQTIESECKSRLKDDFEMFTKIVDWNLLSGLTEIKPYNYLKVSPEETKQRVISIMDCKKLEDEPLSRSRNIDDDTYQKVCMIAGRLFSGIRFFFSKLIRNKLNAFFLDPMFQKLGSFVTDYFSKLNDQKYEEMFQLGLKELENKLHKLEFQLIDCKKNRDKFKDVYNRMKQSLNQNQNQNSSSSSNSASSSNNNVIIKHQQSLNGKFSTPDKNSLTMSPFTSPFTQSNYHQHNNNNYQINQQPLDINNDHYFDQN
ncbi:dynamin like protein [Dictyostelium discoideum AX4]|uniref:Dynamin-like protein C n=1 Tax=Dictyostelium discoideum TaxID=44689 RepID=DLPC_DICDI|nr:dynamin like protein [Dictyostelium discoideum AX4]Q55AX0.2 RecName: Full=Dynamin-like protein C [Dictyostelium discoideum]EAL71678.2 dynamin like protein [Dictyostelium discoideum AX4]|eukprot:XP_645576.2 dynamin like protein [Dictyostelium discoideum AX4]